MYSKTTPFESMDVEALMIDKTPTNPGDLATAGIRNKTTRRPVPNGSTTKKYHINLALNEPEKAAFARLDEWIVQTIASSGFYSDCTVEAVRSKYKPLLRSDGELARLSLFKEAARLHVVVGDQQGVLTYADSEDFDNLMFERNDAEFITQLGCVWMTAESCGVTVNIERSLVWEHSIPFFDDYMNVKFEKKQR
eukprot:4195242-Pleurochrysis_carterae.AAC.1